MDVSNVSDEAVEGGAFGNETSPMRPSVAPDTVADAVRCQQLLRAIRHLRGHTDTKSSLRVVRAALAEMLSAEHVRCLLYRDADGVVLDPLETDDETGRRPSGLVAEALAHRRPLVVARARQNLAFDLRMDDPHGRGHGALMLVPLVVRQSVCLGVLVVSRSASNGAFSEFETGLATALGDATTDHLRQIQIQLDANHVIEAAHHRGPFRSAALDRFRARGRRGDVIRVTPRWIRWTYWAIVAAVVVSLAGLVVGQVDAYSEGPALVRYKGRTEVNARMAGNVATVHVAAGDSVIAGQRLASFDNGPQLDEQRRLQAEFDRLLRARLLAPADRGIVESLRQVRGSLLATRARVRATEVRAPSSGIVSDIRIRAGQHIRQGESLLTLVDPEQGLEVVALLPGRDRAHLESGQTARLELDGHRYAYQDVALEQVGEEIVGPDEARRFLGPQVGDSIALRGSVVVVLVQLPADEFEDDEGIHRYHDGMLGTIEARLRPRNLFTTLFPATERLKGD